MAQTISKQLQDTVKKNEKITKVYFDENGNHYFSIHNVDIHKVDKDNVSIGVDKVKSLPGVEQGVVKLRKKRAGLDDILVPTRVNINYTKVAEEMTREEVLNSKAGNNGLSKAQQDAVLEHAQEILKDRWNDPNYKGIGDDVKNEEPAASSAGVTTKKK